MKKISILCILLVLIVPLSVVFAEESNDDTGYYEISMMLKNSNTLTDVQVNSINELASNMSSMQRSMLYEANKQSPTVPFVVNLLVGCGIGSFVQGDTTGGMVALIGDLVSMGVLYTGYAQAMTGDYYGREGSTMILLGSLGVLTTRIFELVRPFSYASDYNNKLSNALMNISMVPVIDKNNDVQMRLVAKVSL